MAYAALSSLMHTLQQLFLPNQRLVCGSSIQQHAEPAYQSLCAIQIFLENSTQEIQDIENLKVLEKRITDVVHEAEDRVDSSLRNIILANNADDRETTCKIFNNELQQVEKEFDSLRKEVIESKCVELATTSSSSRKYATEQNTVVGIKDDFNTITDSFTAQTNKLTAMPVVGMKDDFNIILDRLTVQTKC
ncbi:uncharacterized protein [Nicotiana sylvestris]|uniref:uncharacterized protein n=1 Tax=Nicotiana sylvestris TaxID=4096 RepID=UPI00388C6BC8